MIKKVDISEVAPRAHLTKYRTREDLADFLLSNEKAAEIVLSDGDTAVRCANRYVAHVRRQDIPVIVCRRGDRVFLVRREKC